MAEKHGNRCERREYSVDEKSVREWISAKNVLNVINSKAVHPNVYSLWVLTRFIVYYASLRLPQNLEVFNECIEGTINDEIITKL